MAIEISVIGIMDFKEVIRFDAVVKHPNDFGFRIFGLDKIPDGDCYLDKVQDGLRIILRIKE